MKKVIVEAGIITDRRCVSFLLPIAVGNAMTFTMRRLSEYKGTVQEKKARVFLV